MNAPRRRTVWTFGLALALATVMLPPASRAQTPTTEKTDPVYLNTREIAELKRSLMMEGEQRKITAAAAEARKAAKSKQARKGKALKAGERKRRAPDEDEGLVLDLPRHARALASRGGGVVNGIPLNTPINNPAGDGANAAQSELSMALLGNFGLAAWNDGQGFITPPGGQGVAYTTDGGATWTDVGPPTFATSPPGQIGDWTSDPVVALNEKTGDFYYCGLINGVASDNGIAIARATFPGGVFTWDVARVVQTLPNATDFHDKEWMVADSSSGNLYVTFTHFTATSDFIELKRSTNNGLTWDPSIKLNDVSGDGRVQGSRPVVAGDGTVYVIWNELGLVAADFIRVIKSADHGVSFGLQMNGFSYFDNFGTGAPGYNRNRNVVEPCPAVDRSLGPNRGRLAVVAHESLNFYDDPLGGGGNKNEIENNGFFASATPFIMGQRLRGGLVSGTTDRDYWLFNATAGTSYVFFVDSIPRPLYTLRVFCGQDTATSLAFSGDVSAPAGGQSVIAFTAPTTGPYYVRLAYVAGGVGSGNYRMETGVAATGPEPGRDQRDVLVHISNDGGNTFSPPSRANDDAPLYDDFLPEVGFTSEGYLYAAWYDFRDAVTNCGGSSNIYAARSRDGGVTWDPSQRVTTKPTAWSFAPTNIQPNAGDYIGLYAGDALALSWGDSRVPETLDVDAWGAIVHTQYTADCPADVDAAPSASVPLVFPIHNPNELFDLSLNYSLTANRSWPGLPATGTTGLAPQASGTVPMSVSVPDTAAPGTVQLCFTTTLPNGTRRSTCCVGLRVTGATGVPDGGAVSFGIQSIQPNPSRGAFTVAFTLPTPDRAKLELIDVNGRLVMEREVGGLGAGRHVVTLDRSVGIPSGMYAVRLSQAGRVLSRKVSVVH